MPPSLFPRCFRGYATPLGVTAPLLLTCQREDGSLSHLKRHVNVGGQLCGSPNKLSNCQTYSPTEATAQGLG